MKKQNRQESLNNVISEAVAYLMEHRNPEPLSQGKLAKLSGVSQGTICMNLKNERGWSIDVLERVLPALGISRETLVKAVRELCVTSALAGEREKRIARRKKEIQEEKASLESMLKELRREEALLNGEGETK